MQTVTLAPELMQKITKAINIAKVRNVEEFVTLAVEEKLRRLEEQKKDPIDLAMGMLKGKKGGTELFMRDKQGRNKMDIVILEEIIHATGMSESELKQEIAILLFEKEKLTLGQASRLCNMSQLQFQHLLASRKIPLHYDISEFEQDLETLKGLGRL